MMADPVPQTQPNSQSSRESNDGAGTSPASHYLVSHGKNGTLSCFTSELSALLPRGTRVVLQTDRGLELGSVLCLAVARHLRLLNLRGRLLRVLTTADEVNLSSIRHLGEEILVHANRLVKKHHPGLIFLDVEILLDETQATLQFLSSGEEDLTPLVNHLHEKFSMQIFLENLAPSPGRETGEEYGGCGKPDCGKTREGENCSTCGSGGGCSSCGTGQMDMTSFFAHLRTRMETHNQRASLL